MVRGFLTSRVVPAVAAVVACALAVVFGVVGERSALAGTGSTAAPRTVVFVPLGTFPRADASALSRYVRSRLALGARVAGSKAVPRSMYDRTRKQYVAQRLITLLSRPASSQDVVIGLTIEDVYSSSEPFRFVFSLRDPDGFAVVSRARMDPRTYRLAPDRGLRMRRLQKMVMKNIGSLAFGHRLSGNPRSVMFGAILSTDDLDFMTDEFRPAAPNRATRTWLRGSNGVCNRAVSREKALIERSKANTPEEVFAFAGELLDLREQHRSELAALPPPADRAAFRALLTRFGKANQADRRAVAALEARWSDEGFIRWLQGRVKVGFALKAAALELGSRACGRYFDPLTYG